MTWWVKTLDILAPLLFLNLTKLSLMSWSIDPVARLQLVCNLFQPFFFFIDKYIFSFLLPFHDVPVIGTEREKVSRSNKDIPKCLNSIMARQSNSGGQQLRQADRQAMERIIYRSSPLWNDRYKLFTSGERARHFTVRHLLLVDTTGPVGIKKKGRKKIV